MEKNRRSFTAEFKLEAANLVIEQGYSIMEACRAMNVGETALRSWVKQLKNELSGITPDANAITPEQQQIQELVKRIKRLELEKEILKKATALLMSDEYKNMR